MLTDAPGKSLHTYNIYIHTVVKLCLPCWYLFICLNLICFGRWMMEDSLEHLIGKKLISLTYFPSVLNKGIQTNIECTPRMTNQCVHMLFMMVLFIYSSALVQRHHLVLEDWWLALLLVHQTENISFLSTGVLIAVSFVMCIKTRLILKHFFFFFPPAVSNLLMPWPRRL